MRAYRLGENYLRNQFSNLNSPYVFLETLVFDKDNHSSFLFTDFKDILVFNSQDNSDTFFKKIENYLNKGYWLAGYFSYEFGFFLEPALFHLQQNNNAPLAWLGVCKKPIFIDHQKKLSSLKDDLFNFSYHLEKIRPNITPAEYFDKIRIIKDYLEQGLSYQVNFTFKVKFECLGSILDFYLNLRRSQPTPYAALINTGQSHILSLSPELFFKIDKNEIVSRPMKGTLPRGLTLAEDKVFKQVFKKSKKIKAENVMIVDLLRNDLGRVARKVWVPKLFNVEKYRTLFQMTSTIKARLKNNLKLKELFSSLFPCGSVTGAPKIKTMEIINQLEKEPRGVYTGAIGYISPYKKACFNVAIRTIQLKEGKGELGIGGGIVYDSTDRSEYEEALLKAKFFIKKFPKFCLIESILLNEGKYFLLDLHLKRLKSSSKYFSFPLNLGKLKKKLEEIITPGKFKVKVLVGMDGDISLEKKPLEDSPSLARVKLSSKRTDPKDYFLYHKTTQRAFYDQELERARKEGFFEVVFLNIYGELTEGAISNIFIVKNNQMYTPPLNCGLLPGTLREYLLKEGRAKEKVIHLDELGKADNIYIGNSLRGLLRVEVAYANNKAVEVVGKV